MPLKDIKMQDRALEFLTASMKRERLPNSLLFFGPESVGKKLTAVAVAKALNCETDGPRDYCGSCPSCRKIDLSNHPDVHSIEPEGPGNVIRIEKIRRMKEAINLKPFEGKAKIFIIKDAHLLPLEAANSMLKILEEPPMNSYIILITNDLNKIIPTIRSRCQWVIFSPANPEALKDYLIEQHAVEAGKAHFLSHFSAGRIGEAISMKDVGSLDRRNDIIDRFKKDNIIFNEDPLFFDNTREELLGIVDVLISWYRDVFVLSNGADVTLLVNIDRLEDLRATSGRLGEKRAKAILDAVLNAWFDIKSNVNPKLVLCDLACKLDN